MNRLKQLAADLMQQEQPQQPQGSWGDLTTYPYGENSRSTSNLAEILAGTEVERGMFAPLVEYADGRIEPGLPQVLNTPIQAVRNMLTPGYDYGNTQQAARDSFDAAGLITTGGLAGAGLKPAGAIGAGGGGLAKGATRAVDDLGFYSKLDEVLGSFNPTNQVTAKALQERGVKAAELEARGLADLLAQGPQSAEALRGAAADRLELTETIKGFGGSSAAKQPKYSLDPSNPTYRETLWQLPAEGGRGFRDSFSHWSERNVIAHARTSMNTDVQGRKVLLVDELQSDWNKEIREAGLKAGQGTDQVIQKAKADLKAIGDVNPKSTVVIDAVKNLLKKEKGFFSGLPNELKWLEKMASENYFGAIEIEKQLASRGLAGKYKELDSALADHKKRVEKERLELLIANYRDTDAGWHPMVGTSDQWQTTAMRRLIKQAVDEGAEVIAIPSGKTVESFGMGGKADGLAYAYDKMYVKNMRNILSKMDKSITPERAEKLITPSKGAAGDGFMLFPITDKVRQAVKEGQPLFTQGTPAAAAISAEDKKRR